MQRVVSIHLNGNVYQLEENGYNALFAYLDATEARLKDSPDRAPLLADLERSIAEQCQACLGPHKTVVTSAEIARMLAEIGPAVEQPAAGPAAGRSAGASSAQSSTSTGASEKARTDAYQHRRLCQIREGGMIGGVCLGLATFFHIDVTLVRILFALFTLATAGWGILAYLALMFILPRAANVAEASAPPTGGSGPQWPWENGGPWGKHGWPWDRPGSPSGPDQRQQWREQRREWREQRRAWREQRRATRMAYGPPPSLFGTLIIVFFGMIAFGWLAYWMRGGLFWGWPVFWGGPFFWGAPHWVGIVLFFMFLHVLLMPLRAARWGWYGHPGWGAYPHPYSPWMAMWHTIVWIGTLIFFAWLAYNFVPGVHEFIRQFQTNWANGRFDV